ncbi:MAG: hypothetical protein JNL98_08185 [Bryobacterales bacterium]|nr:hypothetical protein [Bryobacterales bacterium]
MRMTTQLTPDRVAPPTVATPPPEMMLMQMLMGRTISFALGAIAKTGVADHMSMEAQPVAEIARKASVRQDMLYRVLRMLASVGMFHQEGDRFALTASSSLLRRDAPGSMRNMAMMLTSEWITDAFQQLDGTLLNGVDGVTLAYGKNTWELFPTIPDQADLFQKAMTDFTLSATQAVLHAYDFSSIRKLADVGGGYGTLLAGILKHHPAMQGVLFDLPEVVAGAKNAGLFQGCEDRVAYQAGSFLETAPEGCDAYILKHIIHDWDDAHCGRILNAIRDRMPADGRVLLVEMVVPEGPEPGPAKMLDIEMMAATVGGKERTSQEFEDLFASAGLRLERIVPTPSPMCVLEAHRA